jgi:hypothetical protein
VQLNACILFKIFAGISADDFELSLQMIRSKVRRQDFVMSIDIPSSVHTSVFLASDDSCVYIDDIDCSNIVFLRKAHDINAYRSNLVCLYVRIFQLELENAWTNFHETWYERCAIEGPLNPIFF